MDFDYFFKCKSLPVICFSIHHSRIPLIYSIDKHNAVSDLKSMKVEKTIAHLYIAPLIHHSKTAMTREKGSNKKK